jgi:hypothetical protein
MLQAIWAFFFGGLVEQQVVIVNSATLSDANDYRRRFYAATNGEVPTSIQVEDKLGDGEALICAFLTGGLFRDPQVEVDAYDFEPAEAN